MSSLVIDGFEFCRLEERRSGEFKVAELARLAEETTDGAGLVGWSMEGGRIAQGSPQLLLEVSATVHLMCQRCLTPYRFDIASKSTLVLAKNEEAVDELEALLDDDSIDVIAGNQPLDVAELIEDEALLALPASPRHDVCPDTRALDALKEEKKPSPFAALKGIKLKS